MISTVDPDARHGRKTSSRGFDGYKGHVALDPGSELITATTVTAGNAGEGREVAGLLAEDLAEADDPAGEDDPAAAGTATEPLSVYGDSAYGTGSVLDTLENVGANILCKVKAPVAPAGRFTKDAFRIDIELGASSALPGGPHGYTTSKTGKSPGSAVPARDARCLRSAPPGRPGGRSASARTSSTSLAAANANPIRCGRPTTQRPARRSSGRSVI